MSTAVLRGPAEAVARRAAARGPRAQAFVLLARWTAVAAVAVLAATGLRFGLGFERTLPLAASPGARRLLDAVVPEGVCLLLQATAGESP